MPLKAGTVALILDTNLCASELADATGTHTFTESGTVPYGDQGQPAGNSAAGDFSAGYYNQAATLLAEMAATGESWTWQANVKCPDSGTRVIHSFTYGATHFTFLMAGNKLRCDNGVTGRNTTAVVGDNTWHHVALTWDGTNIKCYVDGVLDYSDTFDCTWPSPLSGNLRIGRYHDAGNFTFAGYLNQMRWMNTVETSFPTVDPPDVTGSGYNVILSRRRR